MKRYGLILLLFPLLTSAQTFQPVGSSQVMTTVTVVQPSLLPGNPIQLVTIVGNVLYAELDPSVGQAAVDSCTAGTTQPLGGQGGIGTTSCENNRQPAMIADVQARAKAGISAIPAATLTQLKLHTVQ